MSSPTDSSSSSSSKSNSSETQQISRSSSRLGQPPKTRLQRKSHSCSRSSRTFKSSSKKRWKDRSRSSRSFCRSRSLQSRSLASAGKRRQLPREPRDSRVQHSSRSDSQDWSTRWRLPEKIRYKVGGEGWQSSYPKRGEYKLLYIWYREGA